MKSILFIVLLALSATVFSAPRSPMIIATVSDSVIILTKTSKFPYNMLLANGPKCYVGTKSDISDIVTKAIKNHYFAAKELEVTEVTDYIESDGTVQMIVQLFNKVRKESTEIVLLPCDV